MPLSTGDVIGILGDNLRLRKYGWLAEIKEATDEGYFRYQVVEREGS